MKLLNVITLGLLMGVSQMAVAEDHSAVALEHAHAAVKHGKMGHAAILVEHAEAALEHTLKALETAEGEEKAHLEAAVKVLEYSIEHGKMDHADIATPPAEEAAEHIHQSTLSKGSAAAGEIEIEAPKEAPKSPSSKWPVKGYKN